MRIVMVCWEHRQCSLHERLAQHTFITFVGSILDTINQPSTRCLVHHGDRWGTSWRDGEVLRLPGDGIGSDSGIKRFGDVAAAILPLMSSELPTRCYHCRSRDIYDTTSVLPSCSLLPPPTQGTTPPRSSATDRARHQVDDPCRVLVPRQSTHAHSDDYRHPKRGLAINHTAHRSR